MRTNRELSHLTDSSHTPGFIVRKKKNSRGDSGCQKVKMTKRKPWNNHQKMVIFSIFSIFSNFFQKFFEILNFFETIRMTEKAIKIFKNILVTYWFININIWEYTDGALLFLQLLHKRSWWCTSSTNKRKPAKVMVGLPWRTIKHSLGDLC